MTPNDPAVAPRANPNRRKATRKGLIIVNTGDGKGKSTAAFGIVLRAWGRGMTPCVIQFLKNDGASFGEHRAAEKLGIEFVSSGDGFTWMSRDLDQSAELARHGWAIAQEKIASGKYDVVVLDEITYCFSFGWLDFADVRAWLEAHKPPMLHVIFTGRNAIPELIEYADLVTEMREIKHPFNEQGIKAQPGIEF